MTTKKTLQGVLTEGLKSDNPWIVLFCQLELGHDIFAAQQASESRPQSDATGVGVALERQSGNVRQVDPNQVMAVMQALQERIDELEAELGESTACPTA